MSVGFKTFVKKQVDTVFIVKNIAPNKKTVSIFNIKIPFGGIYDLLSINYVSEADIQHSLLKGVLRSKFISGEIYVIKSNINLLQFADEQKSFLENIGIQNGLAVDGYSTGVLKVKDDGLLVGDAACLNFVGAGVFAQDDGFGQKTINVYIPPPSFLSHWNTGDGSNGNQFVIDPLTRITTRISTPSGGEGIPFSTNGWSGTNQDTTDETSVIFTTPGDITGFGGTSTFNVIVFDADGSTVLESYTTPVLVGNGIFISPSTNIVVTITNFGPDTLRFKASAAVSVNFNSIFIALGRQGGRFSVRVTHNTDLITDGTGPYIYTQASVFFDTDPANAEINGLVTIMETPGNVLTKHLSGLEYYILNSQFTASALQLDGHNNNTQIIAGSLIWDGAEYGLAGLSHSPFGVGAANFSNYTNLNNQNNIDYIITNWSISSANYRYIGPTANVSVTPHDPWSAGTLKNTANELVLIDTYGVTSGNLVENFDDESFRQDSLFNGGLTSGNWDSTVSLAINEAIIFNSRLMAPSETAYIRSDGPATGNTDWSLFNPTLGGANPDYTGLTVPVNYYRTFIDTSGLSRPSFTFTFGGTFVVDATTDLANSDMEIFIYKINGIGNSGPPPGNIAPLLAHGDNYNFATFDDGITDGQIREASSLGNTVNCTFGGFNDEDGFYFHLRINNSQIQIDNISVTFF